MQHVERLNWKLQKNQKRTCQQQGSARHEGSPKAGQERGAHFLCQLHFGFGRLPNSPIPVHPNPLLIACNRSSAWCGRGCGRGWAPIRVAPVPRRSCVRFAFLLAHLLTTHMKIFTKFIAMLKQRAYEIIYRHASQQQQHQRQQLNYAAVTDQEIPCTGPCIGAIEEEFVPNFKSLALKIRTERWTCQGLARKDSEICPNSWISINIWSISWTWTWLEHSFQRSLLLLVTHICTVA